MADDTQEPTGPLEPAHPPRQAVKPPRHRPLKTAHRPQHPAPNVTRHTLQGGDNMTHSVDPSSHESQVRNDNANQ